MPTEDGLNLSINCMYPVKEFDNLYLGKMGRAASKWLGGRSVDVQI